MKLVIEIPEQFAQGLKDLGMTDDDAQLLIRDALGEFVSARHPVSLYVSSRYKGQSASFQDNKAEEAMKRSTWAMFIKAGEVRIVEE